MGTVSPLTRFQHIRFSLPLQPILLRSLVLDCTTLVKPEPCGERDQSSAIGSTPFLLGDVNKMSVSRPSWRGLCTGKGLLPQSWGRRWDCGDSLSLLLRPGGVQSCVPLGLVGKVLRNPHTGIILRLYLAFMLRCHLLPALFSWDKLSTSFSISVVLASVAESPSEHTWSQAIPGHSFQATNSIRSIVNLVSSREESCILHTD